MSHNHRKDAINLIRSQADGLARLLGHDPDGLDSRERMLLFRELSAEYPYAYPILMEAYADQKNEDLLVRLFPLRKLFNTTPHYKRIEGDFWQARNAKIYAMQCYISALRNGIGLRVTLERIKELDVRVYNDIVLKRKIINRIKPLYYDRIKPLYRIVRKYAANIKNRYRCFRGLVKRITLVRFVYTFFRYIAFMLFRIVATPFNTLIAGIRRLLRPRKSVQDKKNALVIKRGLSKEFRVKLWLLSFHASRNPFTRLLFHVGFVLWVHPPSLPQHSRYELDPDWNDPPVTEGQAIFNYAVVVWGKDYLDALAHISLPSLLAPGNLPELSKHKPIRMVFYTRKQDVPYIKSLSGITRLQGYVTLSFVCIDSLFDPKLVDKYQIMTICHNDLLSRLYGRSDYIIFSNPDAIFADGTFAKYNDLVDKGYTYVVSVAGFRVSQERFTQRVEQLQSDGVLSMAPRDAVALAYECRHRATDGLFVGRGEHSICPTILFWDVDGEGMIAHTMHLTPLLVRVPQNPVAIDVTCDVDILLQDESDDIRIYPVRDSDELFVFSCCTEDDLQDWNLPGGYTPQYISKALTNLADVYQKTYFRMQTRLHFKAETPAEWEATTKRVDSFIAACLALQNAALEV